MMAKAENMGPLNYDAGKSSLRFQTAHLCKECDRTFRSLYNFGVHRAMKHNDWSALKEWAKKKGRKIWWEI